MDEQELRLNPNPEGYKCITCGDTGMYWPFIAGGTVRPLKKRRCPWGCEVKEKSDDQKSD